MTLYKPTIKLTHLLAKKNKLVCFDEEFHAGVNILNGVNGGGKTSIVQLIVFALGYEVDKWKVEAASVDQVYIGLELNGVEISILRKNNGALKQPMYFCMKKLSDAIKSPIDEWERYPYSSTTDKISFSQYIFECLGIPDVKHDAKSNITMHQILRLFYAEQSSPSYYLLNASPFDSALSREALSEYLLGTNNDQIYTLQFKMNNIEKELDKVIAEQRSIHRVLGKTDFNLSTRSAEEIIKDLNSEYEAISSELAELSQAKYVSEGKPAVKDLVEPVSDALKSKKKMIAISEGIVSLEYEIDDAKEFLREINRRYEDIGSSLQISDIVGVIEFTQCPACNTPLKDEVKKDKDSCGLCGTELEDNEAASRNLMKMKSELRIQLDESLKLLEKRRDRLVELKALKRKAITDFKAKNLKAQLLTIVLNPEVEEKKSSLYMRTGEITKELEQLESLNVLYESLNELTEKREVFQAVFDQLKGEIEKLKAVENRRGLEVRDQISTELINILRQDSSIETHFKQAESVEFDFAANIVTVNGKSVFSDSGHVFLKNAFHLAVFLAALKLDYIRLPRFMILDGIENDGMEDHRSQNFQLIVRDALAKVEVDHQIILATKSIAPELESPEYVVGEKFTEDSRSLKMPSL